MKALGHGSRGQEVLLVEDHRLTLRPNNHWQARLCSKDAHNEGLNVCGVLQGFYFQESQESKTLLPAPSPILEMLFSCPRVTWESQTPKQQPEKHSCPPAVSETLCSSTEGRSPALPSSSSWLRPPTLQNSAHGWTFSPAYSMLRTAACSYQ